jgi:hypothetical protein
MLAASTPTWLVGSIPITAIGGGFTSRVIFVVEYDVRLKNAIPFLSPREIKIGEELKMMLEKISFMKGAMQLTPEAIAYFTHWYEHENVKITDPQFAGYAERKHIHLIKTAMILAACDNQSMFIHTNHLKQGLSMLGSIEERMIKAFGGVGRSAIATDLHDVLGEIRNAGMIERNRLLEQVKMNIHPKSFEECVSLLKSTGEILEVVRDGKIWFQLPKSTFKQ